MAVHRNTRVPTEEKGSLHRPNPYRRVAMPSPLPDDWNFRAADIFQSERLAYHLSANEEWLQARPRSSANIEEALFPGYILGGMSHDEVRTQLHYALFDAGYEPDDEVSSNPTWFWTEGK